MDRRKLRKLSETRLQDAKVLISCRRFSAAYYVTGYSVECALKACIAKQTRRFEFPDKKRITDSYTHNLVKLVELAGLKPALELKTKADAAFATNWALVKDWSEEARYAEYSQMDAVNLYFAVEDAATGVLSWIKLYW